MKFIKVKGDDTNELKEMLNIYNQYKHTNPNTFQNLIPTRQHALIRVMLSIDMRQEEIIIPFELYKNMPVILISLRQYRDICLRARLSYLIEQEFDEDAIKALVQFHKQKSAHDKDMISNMGSNKI
ncbi:hypothetical protein AKO1_006829 [Acrasis kona]|uniref:Uncharacterized protein n=1 Tax=Acrasis kona TaxID=1008807 RepID=A0AAW2YU08_9EUKA